MQAHQPVLLEAALASLAIEEDGRYVDGTFGRGGHTGALLARLGPAGRVLACDQDPDAIAAGRARFADEPRLELLHDNFAALPAHVVEQGWAGRVNGLLLDLGVSSPQLDEAERGFSFLRDGPLDMRMNPQAGISAADWLARVAEAELAEVLHRLGEERYRGRIARAICEARREAPITRTGQLAEIIASVVPRREPGKHPATRSFQAIRMQVNGELERLTELLAASLDLLAPGGRLVVISFHSLEDRLVKRFMRDQARGVEAGYGSLAGEPARLRLAGRAQRASEAELAANPRARSAVLRAAERLPEAA